VAFADHTGLPPALMVSCGYDIPRNESVATNRAYETMDAMIAEANKHF
jgi:hypothetical protein